MQGFGRGPHAGPPSDACALMRLSLRVVAPLKPGGADAVSGTDSSGSALRVSGRGAVGLEGGLLLLRHGGSAGSRQGDEDGGHHPFRRRR